MPPKYSVIIPVYNAEKTIRRCLDSLLSAHYENAEIILVNDGSRDRSRDICREYASTEQNILYIEKENGGVSTARNIGLDAASGDYILFVDSDDYVSPTYFSTIDSVQDKTPGDLIQFSYRYDNGDQIWGSTYKFRNARNREALMPIIVDAICHKTINAPWAKLYKRELIETYRIRFPEGVSVAEDRAFNINYSFYIQSYVVTDNFIYVVNTENEHSLTRGQQNNLQQQFAVANEYFAQALDAAPLSAHEKESYQRAVNFGRCRGIYHDAKQLIQAHVGWFTRQRRIGQLCDRINREHMKYPKLRYCKWIALPIRLRLTPVIDAIAWKLTH